MARNAAVPLASIALLVAGIAAAKSFLGGDAAPIGSGEGTDPARLVELERRLARVEAQMSGPSLVAAGPTAGPGSMEERLAKLEARSTAPVPAGTATAVVKDPHELSDKELLVRARGLSKDGITASKDAAEALEVWKELLTRRLDDTLRREALMATGFAHRALKGHVEEEAAFREAMRTAGSDEAAAQWARYQIAWAQSFRGEVGAARETMSELTRIGGGSKDLVGHARLYEADWSLQLEDPRRAREILEGIVRDLALSSAPTSTWLVEQAKERLRRLDGR